MCVGYVYGVCSVLVVHALDGFDRKRREGKADRQRERQRLTQREIGRQTDNEQKVTEKQIDMRTERERESMRRGCQRETERLDRRFTSATVLVKRNAMENMWVNE